MTRLTPATLHAARAGTRSPAYNRASRPTSLVHLGPGVFHRAHQAVYVDALLAAGAPCGLISAVSLRTSSVRDALEPQGGLYTLLERADDRVAARVVGAIGEVLVAADDPRLVLDRLTSPAVSIVTLTITEKGYAMRNGEPTLDTDHPDIAHDIATPAAPRSAVGFLVEALVRRRAAGIPPFAAVSCDNLRRNGRTLRALVVQLAELRGLDVARHVGDDVAFPCSMVDRMVPATVAADRTAATQITGLDDAWPVTTEPYSRWVLEDAFVHARPPFEDVGIELVGDVAPYETAKLRVLNGAHSALAYLGLLAGLEHVHEAASDLALVGFVERLVAREVVPTLPGGGSCGFDLPETLARFRNRALGYTTAKVASDGSQKLPVRVLATVRDRLVRREPVDGLAAVIAAWACCVAGPEAAALAIDDPIVDARLAAVRGTRDADALTDRVLGLHDVFGPDLPRAAPFTASLRHRVRRLLAVGPRAAAAEVYA